MPPRGVGPGRKTLALLSGLGFINDDAISPPRKLGFHSRARRAGIFACGAQHPGGRRFRQIAGEAQVFEHLADAPSVRLGVRVQLRRRERPHERVDPVPRGNGHGPDL